MKHLSILILIISACSVPSERDLLVIDKEQTLTEGVQTDLNMKIISSVDLGYYTGADSLDYYFEFYSKKYEQPPVNLDSLINRLNRNIEFYNSIIKEREELITEGHESAIRIYNEGKQKEQLRLDVLLKWKNKMDEKIWKKVKYLYKFNNPTLNGAEQEIAKTFLFSLDETEIVGAL